LNNNNKTYIYSETCLNRTWYKPQSFIKETLDQVPNKEIFAEINCINQIGLDRFNFSYKNCQQ
jgi:hypothetical protein